jgi:surface polysaccharide O-acyltransferase-like enzyme
VTIATTTRPAQDEAAFVARDGGVARNGGIDALRASVTLLVILHHTALTYGAIGGWFYREIAPSQTPSSLLLILFCTLNQAWFMGLFFLIAGYFTPGAVERHGVRAFARERLLRLGVPLLVFATLLGPATIALARTAANRPFTAVLLYRWRNGLLEPGPLWFAEALLIFTGIFLLLRSLRPARTPRATVAFPSNRALLIAALATGSAAFLLRLEWPVGENVAALQLGYFSSYVVLFAAGCLGAKGRWLETVPPAQARLWGRIACAATPIFPAVALLAPHFAVLQGRAEGGWNVQAAVYAFWEPFVAWGVILGLLRFFQRRLAAPSELWRRLSRRAFLIYIIHPPILVGAALAWRSVAAPPLLKFAVTGLAACVLCYLVAGLLLRAPAVRRVV